ncbi:MAG: acyl-CoA/acyl-ACP dehydrogenase [Brevundimonas sp.]|uniref:acyl-CoA dehydrogenase family protein n=1 Tax=Brevundimonas sp. TaxID=1871086 RepID=UPI002486E7F5|nr:acyl-CoA dehydrogenase family protein [Brevundimonas sp.]MDI1328506.1 acyl-CoA/acyl-ACP dehydrogenase [Brevundimonas sp.]
MDFAFSDEQQAFAEVVRNLLRAECTAAHLRRLIDSGAARDGDRWRQVLDLGLTGLMVPDAKGGLGLDETDFVLIAQACGHAALPEPLVEQTGVVLPLLAAIDHPRACAWLDRTLTGEVTVALSHPSNPFVADADTAAALLLVHDGALHLVESPVVELIAQPGIDPFRRLSHVIWTPSTHTLVADSRTAAPLLATALERGAIFAAAQSIGLAERSVELAVDYAKERIQFGKPIGVNQAVKHLLATAQVKIEFARPVVFAAAAERAADNALSRARASHAKLAAAEAASLAARTAIQVHGAMGYSWEVDVHFLLKRALALSGVWGDESFHRARVRAHAISAADIDHSFAWTALKEVAADAA